MKTWTLQLKLDDLEEHKYQYEYQANDEDAASNDLLPIEADTPYLRRSIRDLRYHQPIDARVLKHHPGLV